MTSSDQHVLIAAPVGHYGSMMNVEFTGRWQVVEYNGKKVLEAEVTWQRTHYYVVEHRGRWWNLWLRPDVTAHDVLTHRQFVNHDELSITVYHPIQECNSGI